MRTRLTLFAATLLLAALTATAADTTAKTQQLVGVLQSDAPLFDKARACQQLGEIGTADAVPALAALLTDPKLSAFARSGLEGIADSSAKAALRTAAQKVQGLLLAGVINSLGALRDPEAVDILSRLAVDPASGVVRQALFALGNIATPASIPILRQALTSESAIHRADAAAAGLLAADRLRMRGGPDQAMALYDLIRKAEVPIASRVGATRGAILARKTDRVPFLMTQLKWGEPAIRNAALLTVREIPDDALATALNAEVGGARPDLQRQLLLALADCHNAQSTEVIQALGDSRNAEVRKTVLTVLGKIGPGAALPLLAALEKDRPAEERALVLSSLKTLPGPAVDDLLRQRLSSPAAPGIRVELIRLLESRGAVQSLPELIKQAAASEKEVTIAAWSALRLLAGPNDVPALLKLTKSSEDQEGREAAENALAGICSRSSQAACLPILTELKQATTASERQSWIRVLARGGCAQALPTIEAATNDSDSTVAQTAVGELGRWPDSGPMETLLKIVDATASSGQRQQALASVIDLASTAADEAQVPAPTIASWLQRAIPAVQSTQDKLRILGVLGRLKTVESFRLLIPYLEDPTVRTEAASGIVQIASTMARDEDPGAVKAALGKIAATVSDAGLRDRAVQVSKSIPAASTTVSLFDGRSLEGWEGDTNVWRVHDGIIVGGSMKGNPRNEFLATTRSYTNFLLRVEYKLIGTEGFVNSGVQFRSVRVSNPPNEMSGFQADIGAGYSGCLYDESRRNKMLVRASDETIKRFEKAGDWNRYEIQCESTHIQLRLNGEKTVDYTELDPNIPLSGLIGLQIHGGNKAEVSFRNITIREMGN